MSAAIARVVDALVDHPVEAVAAFTVGFLLCRICITLALRARR